MCFCLRDKNLKQFTIESSKPREIIWSGLFWVLPVVFLNNKANHFISLASSDIDNDDDATQKESFHL